MVPINPFDVSSIFKVIQRPILNGLKPSYLPFRGVPRSPPPKRLKDWESRSHHSHLRVGSQCFFRWNPPWLPRLSSAEASSCCDPNCSSFRMGKMVAKNLLIMISTVQFYMFVPGLRVCPHPSALKNENCRMDLELARSRFWFGSCDRSSNSRLPGVKKPGLLCRETISSYHIILSQGLLGQLCWI